MGKATVLFVEDDPCFFNDGCVVLRRRGYRVLATPNAGEAMLMIRQASRIDVAVTDLRLPVEGVKDIGMQESEGGRLAGLIIARELRRKFKRVPVIFWSGLYDRHVRSLVLELGNARLVAKAAGPEPVLDFIDEALDGYGSKSRPRCFVVHGHNETVRKEVCEYIVSSLKFPPPVVLRDTPNYGRTVIEKLESHTSDVDLVFVLLTPDDRVVPSDTDGEERFRSRQNVIFEMGYFLGVLGRYTGRVILLYHDGVELPSDISGMISIDITNGVRQADGKIRQELREWA